MAKSDPRGESPLLRRSRNRRPGARTSVGAIVVVLAASVVAVSAGAPVGAASAVSAGQKALDNASTSSRGVTSNQINVVFPVSNLTGLASNFGFAGDAEFAAQDRAITTYVNAANAHGGINGRKIHAIIRNFDPTSETGMRALCKQWTEGSPAVFAVVDGLGSWTGDNELCITQEGHTPFIGEWTTVSNYTQEGAPYLWWTGADQASILATLVTWAKGAGLIGTGKKVAIVAGSRASDQLALKDYLLPDFRRAGLPAPLVETLPADPSEPNATSSAAPLLVQHLQAAGIKVVLPLIPFNALFPYLQAEDQELYYPKLLLSDYEGSINVSLGLIPTPYEEELNGQEGVTAETLGGVDGPTALVGKGGYDPGVANCYKVWHAANPKPLSGQTLIHGEKASPYIEEQGPIAGWCQGIELFALAAKKAGRDLTRRSFVKAMASIKNFEGTYSPTLSYGPGKYAGPDQYQVVQLHNNVPASSACALTWEKITQGTCWRVIQSWKPLVTS